jgi:hypothetical protein
LSEDKCCGDRDRRQAIASCAVAELVLEIVPPAVGPEVRLTHAAGVLESRLDSVELDLTGDRDGFQPIGRRAVA